MFVISIAFLMTTKALSQECSNCSNNLCNTGINIVKNHPIITAFIIVLLLHEEPRECLKGIISFFVEEHPIFTTFLLAFFISGAYKKSLICIEKAKSFFQYSKRGISYLFRIILK